MALGRGLGTLLTANREGTLVEDAAAKQAAQTVEIAPREIVPSRLQPRKRFDDAAQKDLEASIREHGILQPVVVRRRNGRYELVAGERRWRAAVRLNLSWVPVRVLELADEKALAAALVENLQREDLNPVEKAQAFRDLATTFNLTQEEIARRVGLERSSVANFIRILDLPAEVVEKVSAGRLSMGHARALLALKDPTAQVATAEKIEAEQASVRDAEMIVSAVSGVARPANGNNGNGHAKALALPRGRKAADPVIAGYEERLQRALGAKVRIRAKNGRGRIAVSFTSDEEFLRILNLLERRFSV